MHTTGSLIPLSSDTGSLRPSRSLKFLFMALVRFIPPLAQDSEINRRQRFPALLQVFASVRNLFHYAEFWACGQRSNGGRLQTHSQLISGGIDCFDTHLGPFLRIGTLRPPAPDAPAFASPTWVRSSLPFDWVLNPNIAGFHWRWLHRHWCRSFVLHYGN